jgi:DNA-binding response OmpR family regulator
MSKRILVIDDHKLYNQMMCDILRSRGYEADPCVAITPEMIDPQNLNYDLIILDLNMPDLTGFDIIQQCNKKNLQIPILVVSGYLTPDLHKKLNQLGIQHTLSKPFATDHMLLTVAGLFSTKRTSYFGLKR